MTKIQVAVISESDLVKPEAIKRDLPALQKQIHEDFAPVWGIDAELCIVPKGKKEDATQAWRLIITDEPKPDAVGHHYSSGTPQNTPSAKMFAKKLMDEGSGWTTCASHELLEMLVNPRDNRVVEQCENGLNRFWYQEICDPCETDSYLIILDDDPNHEVYVSNFVYPSWFGLFYNPNDPRFHRRGKGILYDHKGNINKQFQIVPGGHAKTYTIGGWGDQLAAPSDKR